MTDLVQHDEEFARAQAEMDSIAGLEFSNIDYIRYNPTSGIYDFGKDEPPLKKFQAVISYVQEGNKLWPNENDTKLHSLGLIQSDKPLCQSNSIKHLPTVSKDAPEKVLSDLGWNPELPCERCPLRQFDENLGTTPCPSRYRIALVILDRQGNPAKPDGWHTLELSKWTATKAFKNHLKESRKKGPTTDSIVEFSGETGASPKAPVFKIVGVASPELRQHCRSVTVMAMRVMSKQPRQHGVQDSLDKVNERHGESLSKPAWNDNVDMEDLPF